MQNKLKIIFAGTPDFAVPVFKALLADADFEIAAVITQEDKPVGRKQTLTPPPVKVVAQEFNLKIFQPDKIKNIKDEIAALKPDFIVVVAYGQIIPQNILDIPKYGCVNVHASLLPRWRGAAVIQAPILAGDAETGVTIMKMDAGLDTGPIIAQMKINILKNETAETLHDELAKLGAQMLPETLKSFARSEMELKKQDDKLATYARRLTKEDGKIDWTKSAAEIERMVRAYAPWPGAFGQTKDKRACPRTRDAAREELRIVKILEVENTILPINKFKIGEIFLVDGELTVQCGEGALVINKLQLEGGKPMSAEEFLRGHADFVGTI
ncbi:MAG TPA: methionyl-tRNA formyltransferase, partial [Candidatus Methylomirabilis sp.]|nr:methionyl-tRNA formyltransferase [Candidatus Methylomirabilis sp.]